MGIYEPKGFEKGKNVQIVFILTLVLIVFIRLWYIFFPVNVFGFWLVALVLIVAFRGFPIADYFMCKDEYGKTLEINEDSFRVGSERYNLTDIIEFGNYWKMRNNLLFPRGLPRVTIKTKNNAIILATFSGNEIVEELKTLLTAKGKKITKKKTEFAGMYRATFFYYRKGKLYLVE